MTEPKLEFVDATNSDNPQPKGSVFDDLESLRKASKITVQRKVVLVNVAVDRPANNSYFRAHPDRCIDNSTVVKDSQSGVYYFVHPCMRDHPKLAPRLRWVTLAVVAIWPADTVLIWPVPILTERSVKAWRSARTAYELSRDCWVQIVWNDVTSDYTVETAEGIHHQPNWPDKEYSELLKLGFDGKIIDSEEHAYVRQLRGLSD